MAKYSKNPLNGKWLAAQNLPEGFSIPDLSPAISSKNG
jgi:hypothetical protein